MSHPNNRWVIKNRTKKISSEYVKLVNTLRKKVFKNHLFKSDTSYKHIIVSRSRAIRRKLINEKELIKKLQPYNFKLIYFEECDYETQINIARNCKIMIGYHGAGLTNLFFMKSKSLVIEIFNENYKYGNALSVQMAQPFVDGQDFILAMGDHMASSSLIANVMKSGDGYQCNVLGVDFGLTSYNAHEATRVLVGDKEKISSIGKHIRIWNGIDSGVFRFTSQIYDVINQWVNCDKSERYELGDMLAYFIDQGGLLKSCDISGQFWHDIDNLNDLEHLKKHSFQPN